MRYRCTWLELLPLRGLDKVIILPGFISFFAFKVCLLISFSINSYSDPKIQNPSASNKIKSADDQVAGANAKANSSPDKAEKVPDAALVMCREICSRG